MRIPAISANSLTLPFVGVLILGAARQVRAVERHVPSQHATVQVAIDASGTGDEVIIAPGTYSGTGNRDIDFKGKAITVRSANPNDPAMVAGTVIDCQGTETDPHRGFFFHSGEGSDSVLAGVTITNGRALSDTSEGGAVYCDSHSSPTITECTISGNSAVSGFGGAVSGDASIVNCRIIGNSAWGGAGISGGTITGCTILENSAGNWGGGIIGAARIDNCMISGNSANYGGGIANSGIVTNCTISENSAACGGGAWSVSQITNCTIRGNSAAEEGGGVYGGNGGTAVTITSCTISENYAKTGGGVSWVRAEGCIISDNTSIEDGGGVGFGTVVGCTITGNSSAYGGGVGGRWSGGAQIINCVINRNSGICGGGVCNSSSIVNTVITGNSATRGGAFYYWFSFGGGTPTVVNSILWNNSAAENGQEIAMESRVPDDPSCSGTLSVRHCDVAGGQAAVYIPDQYHTLDWGSENLNTDPLFMDPDGPDNDPNTWEDNNYHLLWGSPCIEAGSNSEIPTGITTDIDGDARIIDADSDGVATVDIGPDEFIPGARIHLAPESIMPVARLCSSAADSLLIVRNMGSGTLNYTISDDANWLWVSPESGDSTGEEDTIAVHYATAALPLGTYSATITVSDSAALNNPQTVAVTLTVAPIASDFSGDGDVDGFDFLLFSTCFNGSNKPLSESCEHPEADLDGDGDVDGFDFLTFSNCFNGSNRPPRCP